MMDCLRAQELVSSALDGASVDATELAAAKSHCRECSECAAFVRVLLAVKQAGLPEPPTELADNIMAAVRAEAAATARAVAVAASAEQVRNAGTPRAVTPLPVPETRPARTWRELLDRALEPRHRRALVGWTLATAALFIAAGIGALAGVRTILVPQRASEMTVVGTATDEAASKGGSLAAPESADTAATESQSAALPAAGPSFIVVDGAVYRYTGPAASVSARDLDEVAKTSTALDEGGSPSTRDVLGADDDTRVYLELPDDTLAAFQRVTRTFEGAEYVLQSGAIERFGDWPSLPAGIQQPTAEDGSPSFEQVGADAAGVTVYAARGSSAADGIAVAPGAPSGDPLAGAPVWSWWAPSR